MRTIAPSLRPEPPSRAPSWARAARLVAVLCLLAAMAGCNEVRTPVPPEEEDGVGIAVSAACQPAPALAIGAPPDDQPTGDWAAVEPPADPECFALRAEREDASGVDPSSAFILESAERFDVARLAEIVAIEPPFDFSATEEERAAGAAGAARVLAADRPFRYHIRIAESLPEGATIRFRLLAEPQGRIVESWAFAVSSPLRIVGSLPASQAADVPIDAGIELTFSHPVADPEGLVAITPAITAVIETRGRTVVVAPGALEPETLYTVTVDGALASEDGSRTLGEPYALRFETGRTRRGEESPGDPGPAVRFGSRVWDIPVDEDPVVAVQGQREAELLAGADVAVEVWRYPEQAMVLEDLRTLSAIPSWTWHARADWQADASRLEPARSLTATLEAVGEFGEHAVRLGAPLDPGWYLVAVAPLDEALDATRRPAQAWVQVTDVAAYVAVSGSRTLVWANDAAAGEPLEDAAISAAGEVDVAASTDAAGTAFFDTPAALVAPPAPAATAASLASGPVGAIEVTGIVEVVAADGRRALVPLSSALRPRRGFFEWYGDRAAGRYASYLYTDRSLYRMTDATRYWAVLVPRHGAEAPEEALVELVGWTSDGEAMLARARAVPGTAGTMLGELSFAGATPGYYTLRLRVGSEVLASTGIEVRDFVKPAYALDVVPSRRGALVGDVLTATVRARFFEGSPVPKLGVAVESNGQPETLVTDAAGEAVWTVPLVTPSAETGSAYEAQYLSARPSRGEEGDVGGGAMVYVFPGAMAVRASSRIEGDTAIVTGTVHAIDLARLEEGDAADPEAALAEVVADRPVSAAVKASRWNAVRTGERYDFIRKAVVPTYRYEVVEELVGTFDAVSDAAGAFEIAFPAEPNVGYVATVTVADDAGRASGRSIWIGRFEMPQDDQVTLVAAADDDRYALGETVALRMAASNPTLLEGGRALFLRAAGGLRDFVVSEETSYAFAFAEEDVPNIVTTAVYFTGRTYLEAPVGYNARLDTDDRRLDVSIEAGAARYAPGDEATVVVRVADALGRPVEGAEVLLSAIDAAIVRLQGFRGDDPLDALYRSVPSGILGTAASHRMPSASAGAEGGGGGGDARDDLRDTVLFEQVTTDENGEAEAYVELPDNLTSWAVRGIAVTDELAAGAGGGEIVVGLPLFVDATLPPTLLADDEAVLRLRAFGDALEEGDAVDFEVAGAAEPLSATGTAFEPVDLPLGALPAGRLALRVSAASGELSDALVRPIEVLPSRLAAAESAAVGLGVGATELPAPPGGGRVHLTLADRGRGRYYADLAGLSWTRGDRLDQQLGRSIALAVLAEAYGEPAGEPFSPGVYQVAPAADPTAADAPDAGGLALLPYGGADLGLSALAAAAAPTAFARAPLASYFQRVAADPDETGDRIALALWGLAELGEPVLQRVGTGLAGDADPSSRLALGLASAALGDAPAARAALASVLAELGEARGSQARVALDDEAATLEATWRAALLAATLAQPLAPALYDYAASNPSPDAVDDLARAAFVRRLLPNLAAGEAAVAYELEGERAERRLAAGEVLSLDLSADQLAALDLEVLEGELVATLTSVVPIEVAASSSDDLSIARSYAVRPPGEGADVPAGEDAVELEEGDLVVVTLTPQLGPGTDRGCYQVSDLLPSGLQAVTPVFNPLAYYGEDTDIDHPLRIEGQRVSFCAVRGDEGTEPIRYLARAAVKGAFWAEPPVIQSLAAPGDLTLGEAAAVTVR